MIPLSLWGSLVCLDDFNLNLLNFKVCGANLMVKIMWIFFFSNDNK